uniref:EF-hand domain-containing protein n=1 Tax=Canis lupus familiaris TaxID=9615 RepID=A0A8P0TUX7_CANLF
MLASLGKNPINEYLEGMMSEAPGPINFTMLLTMFGEKLNGTDPEDVIQNAFACFDEEASGFIREDHLRELLTTMGDRFTDEEVDESTERHPLIRKATLTTWSSPASLSMVPRTRTTRLPWKPMPRPLSHSYSPFTVYQLHACDPTGPSQGILSLRG